MASVVERAALSLGMGLDLRLAVASSRLVVMVRRARK